MCYAFCNVSYFVYWLYIMYRDFLWYISIFSKDMAYSFTEYLKIDMLPYIERGGVVGKFFSPSIVQHFSFNSRLQRSGNSFSFTISTNNIFHLSVYYFCFGNSKPIKIMIYYQLSFFKVKMNRLLSLSRKKYKMQ